MLTTDRLVTSHLLLEAAGEYLNPNERFVEQAMNPMWRMDHHDPTSVDASFLVMLRTAEIFVLDRESRGKVWASFPPPNGIELPPLPYRRCIIEVAHEDQAVPYIYWNADLQGEIDVHIAPPDTVARHFGPTKITDMTSGQFHGIYCLAIHEIVQGELWDVFMPYQDSKGMQQWAYRIGPNGVIEPQLDGGDKDSAKVFSDWLLLHVVNCAHIITARGVAHSNVILHRKQRRRYERQHKHRMPSIYKLDLANASESQGAGPGTREYTVRWMVRGHWRHTPNGTKLCTHHNCDPKRPATWIPSHVKGPLGAPWKEELTFKGKPIYVQRKDEDAA